MSSRDTYPQGELVPGTVYRVLRMLAEGGMGTVYDVEDTSIGKRYVLKTLHSDLGNRADLARRMQAEARVLASLNHPNVVEVVTAGVTADESKLPYFVMERLNGQNLRVVLQKKGALEVHHALHIAIDLLDALDHAHDRGIVHRDVKPENIFLHRTATGVTVTKLLDFGVMTLLGGQTHTDARFVGTLRYAAPEQINGETATPKADLYAAALVLYEMCAGTGPFDFCVDAKEIAAAHLHAVPKRLSEVANIVPKLDELVMRSLAKDPAERPGDAFGFASALRALQSQKGQTHTQQTTVSGITLDTTGAAGIALEATERKGSGTQPLARPESATLRLADSPQEGPPNAGPIDRSAETLTRAPTAPLVPQVDTSIMDPSLRWPTSQPATSSVRPAVTTVVPRPSNARPPAALLLALLFATLTLASFAGAWTWVGRHREREAAAPSVTEVPERPSVAHELVNKVDETPRALSSSALPQQHESATVPSAQRVLPKRTPAAQAPKMATAAPAKVVPGKVESGLPPSRSTK